MQATHSLTQHSLDCNQSNTHTHTHVHNHPNHFLSRIPVVGYSVRTADEDSKRPFSFSLSHSGVRTMYWAAEDYGTLSAWLVVLFKATQVCPLRVKKKIEAIKIAFNCLARAVSCNLPLPYFTLAPGRTRTRSRTTRASSPT